MKNEKYALYKAVKHEVETYPEDHGYSLVELWGIVSGNTNEPNFWRNTCVRDYLDDTKSK